MTKGRSNVTYQHKLNRVKKWYALREKWRKIRLEEAKKNEKEIKLKELKPLEWYVEKLKKPNAESKKKISSASRPSKPIGGWW